MSVSEPFQFLVELSQKIQSIGPALPAQQDIQKRWSGIGFNVLGQRMIAPLGEVVEMLPVPSVTRLPGVQEWVLGLANVRGRLLPLFDLEVFFGGQPSAHRLNRRVLILEMGDLYAGLVVNEAYGMQHFPENLAVSDLPEKVSHLAAYSKGAYEQDGLTWMSFSPYNLVRDPRFFNAAAA
ncbi:MAG: purine-binding chemotaxis protein CheW [Pseudomonadales bacterium]|nr:purine-binding chemotaxis protein CheW [Pseudomonadales bacterium]